MRTIQIRQPFGVDQLHLTDTAERDPGPGEVQVHVRASSINFRDYFVVTGMMQAADGRVPMSDGAGEVIAIGDGVTEFAVGDRVMSTFYPLWSDGEFEEAMTLQVPGTHIDGFAREYVTAPVAAFTRAPKGYSHAEAATLPCVGVTVWRALVINGAIKAGETVLVQGTGGFSIFALQFAKAVGATVIATSSSDEKLARLKELGADHLINYKSTPNWGDKAREITDGRGADHVLEIGGAGTLPQSIAACRFGGHIAMIGALDGMSGDIPVVQAMSGNQRLIGLTVGSRRHQLDLVRAIEVNGIRPVIDKHFPLEELADAFRYQETGRHFGKICIDI